jgi:hypothetical protein
MRRLRRRHIVDNNNYIFGFNKPIYNIKNNNFDNDLINELIMNDKKNR